MEDYYAVLEVDRNASEQEIKQSYRRLANKYHPDKNPSPEAQEKIRLITEAYRVLGDRQRKLEYDQKVLWAAMETFSTPKEAWHPDPYFRGTGPPMSRDSFSSYDLMKQYLPKMLLIPLVALILSILIGLDVILEENQVFEKIALKVSMNQSGEQRLAIVTESGEQMYISNNQSAWFYTGQSIVYWKTPIFGVVRRLDDQEHSISIRMGFIYKELAILPQLLFFVPLLAIVFRKKIAFSFNLCLISGFLLFLVLVLLDLL